MSYDDSIYRRRDSGGADPTGTGSYADARFDDDSGYPEDSGVRSPGYQAGRFVTSDYPDPDPEPERERRNTARHRSVSPAVLDDVFDDPTHGEPGRDRLAVHAVIEILLLAVAAGLAYLLYRENPDAVRAAQLDGLLVSATALGLLVLGAGMTLRTGAPNLALGPVAIAAALHFAENGDQGVVTSMLPAMVAATGAGLVLALLVVVFHVPGWAASLAAGLGTVVFIQLRTAPVDVQGGYDPTVHALYLFGGFAALAALGGMFGSIKTVRRTVGRFRPTGDPAHRRGGAAATITAAAIVASMLFAMAAGVLLAAGGSDSVAPSTGFEWSGLAIGAALLGGTSAFGRRGGVFGTLLAVVALTLFLRLDDERGLDIALAAVAAVTLAAGLVVTRLVEAYGRPRSAIEVGQEWEDEPEPPATPTWSHAGPERTDTWSTLPGQVPESRVDPWTTDRWTDR
ncbi:ABC transporter permease [Solwaraspora sp. WMMD1047]|uniref:ABC transporter permease n=1 Tax=Solwaraspora sp. WMMD1047 TaxID=3016102 RepID=UPI0024169709|nr:ABC transporter permease [Solwaraspora sp. WMMD1047]MDG4828061.1 ABC transporter permease [Solwaraspora sp. WMMD1047]